MSASTTHRRPVVLIVDDEAVVTQSLAMFLELETDYEVLQSLSPRDALKMVRETPADVVISDFLMPEMNGLEFLSEMKRIYPDTARILLTGYADKENSIRAINEVGLFQYLEKPWDNDQLKLVVQNAITNKGLRESLTERIRELDAALLEKARLAERHDYLKEELQLAQRMQRSMLPEVLPSANELSLSAHYLPALEVGGDFYDVIPLAGDRLGVLVADATGHGIQAALSTAVVKFAFSQFKNCEVGATDIVKEMNKVLLRGLPSDTFTAATVLTIDMSTARCNIINAGLPHPFLLKRTQKSAERVIANGMLLGIVDDDLYNPEAEQVVQLRRGDFLFLYTDGISEAQNAAGEQFDDAMMKTNLLEHADKSGDEISKSLIAASRAFTHTDHDWDDITLFGIERT